MFSVWSWSCLKTSEEIIGVALFEINNFLAERSLLRGTFLGMRRLTES